MHRATMLAPVAQQTGGPMFSSRRGAGPQAGSGRSFHSRCVRRGELHRDHGPTRVISGPRISPSFRARRVGDVAALGAGVTELEAGQGVAAMTTLGGHQRSRLPKSRWSWRSRTWSISERRPVSRPSPRPSTGDPTFEGAGPLRSRAAGPPRSEHHGDPNGVKLGGAVSRPPRAPPLDRRLSPAVFSSSRTRLLPLPTSQTITLEAPTDADRVSAFLDIRVADIEASYKWWSECGAEFLAPPIKQRPRDALLPADPDGHLIEVGQSNPR